MRLAEFPLTPFRSVAGLSPIRPLLKIAITKDLQIDRIIVIYYNHNDGGTGAID
jgi:hypothetical protein